MQINYISSHIYTLYLGLVLLFCNAGCTKLVEVDPPSTSLTGQNVFTNDATAAAVLNGIYITMGARSFNFVTGTHSLSLLAGLSADELTLWSAVNNSDIKSYYYRNELSATPQINAGSEHWSSLYNIIFITNSIIEGLNKSSSLTESVKQQLLGEAKFIRGFCYFYLVNLYGDVPLNISTDYSLNEASVRSSKDTIYQQIVSDLKDAQNLLSSKYLDGSLLMTSDERVRPTKGAATALLARVYLYMRDWPNAELQATNIIDNTALYNIVPLNDVFLKDSKEAIWQLSPINPGTNTEDGLLFILPSSGPNASSFLGKPVYLSDHLLNSFEPTDKRKLSENWVNSVTVDGVTYHYPFKYKALQFSITSPPTLATEYLMILRLSEQYLIRAEARAQQDKIDLAKADLNVIRTRAGLNNTAANDKLNLLTAIVHERQTELFSEWGHRWFDLKRTGRVDEIMSIVTPAKGGNWRTTDQLYPLPLSDIQRNQNLTQNPDY